MPVILWAGTLFLKKAAPVRITNTGVSELRVPANALSIFSSAIQNRKAGIKLPRLPDRKTIKSFLVGMLPIYFNVIGNKIIPADKTRKAATWYEESCCNPNFIKIKLLPQIKESIINNIQLIKFLFIC